MQSARITGLWIYPVKSCRGISLQEMQFSPTGPLHDRKWMIVDDKNCFITLRTVSKLAEIKTAIHGPFLHLYAENNKILVDMTQECEQFEDVTVWNDTFKAGIENISINEALSDFLSKSVKLVRYQTQSFRDIKQWGTSVVKETMFTDGHPVLLVNQSSLDDVNAKLIAKGLAPSQIERFRANIVIEGLPAYSEEVMSNYKVKSPSGDVILTHPKHCGRCPIITQDVETGKVVSKETLQLLAAERKIENSKKIPFGVNLTPQNLGLIRIGEEIFLN
jgi:uncharacterized protein YcbX